MDTCSIELLVASRCVMYHSEGMPSLHLSDLSCCVYHRLEISADLSSSSFFNVTIPKRCLKAHAITKPHMGEIMIIHWLSSIIKLQSTDFTVICSR